jgi:hypothetical protein
MNLHPFLNQMAVNAQSLQHLTAGVTDEQARWKPAADSWSMLEAINHLYDEEREDFRVRLDIILHRQQAPWPSIDPQGWVTSREYNTRDLEQSVRNFLHERDQSLAWLRSLEAPDMEAMVTSRLGSMRAGDMFAAWVAHDLLHMRQLVELHYAYTTHLLRPYSPQYAGDW